MRLTKRLAALAGAALAATLLGAGSAHAADDGSLLSLLNLPSITLVCYPTGQAGANNTFTGTQNISCSQSAQSTSGGSGGGFTGYEVVAQTNECPVNNTCGITLRCPEGKKVTGGGVYVNPLVAGVRTVRSGTVPGEDNTRWDGAIHNGHTAPVDLTVQAICADVDG
ncbi:hypothetical protein [Streptomyces sp. NBC_00091]|uniref:hypothetical protein n=1 Tax=Streptomyces sp. NBC_00091 TaxID=2975648 RepID=UPI00225B565B|nr:hypothetical protein [Streptomyces sp. NBC_00091]MCX5378593.1 hypothetical protein [Streptomyces sp. NBC_00091]